jgi:hypothetical protein
MRMLMNFRGDRELRQAFRSVSTNQAFGRATKCSARGQFGLTITAMPGCRGAPARHDKLQVDPALSAVPKRISYRLWALAALALLAAAGRARTEARRQRVRAQGYRRLRV